MKFKLIAFLLLCICAHESIAQKQFAPPTEKDWNNYFFSKEKAIRTKLFNLALEGKITAYKNDSLAGKYSIEDLKSRGNFEIVMNEQVGNVSMNADKLEHIWFIKTITTSPFESTESNVLKCIAITFSPIFGSIKANQSPFCLFAPQDVKKMLTPEEYNWLMLIYHYTKNDNTLVYRDLDDYDVFWEINHVKNSYVANKADSSLYKKLGISLLSSNFYMEEALGRDIFHGDTMPALIYDLQTKQYIDLYKFETSYSDETVVFLATDLNDPTVGYDTMIANPFQFRHINSFTVNASTYKITSFNYEFVTSNPPKKTYRFTIATEPIRNLNTLPAVFWFFEDYFRWKSK
ncbi:MAG: hypothetical protein V4613_05775 [Bacteroidota bacterium]